MNKILRYSFLAFLAIVGMGNAMADNVTVTFEPGTTQGNNTSASGEDTMTKDGITISTTSGGLAAAQYRFAKSSVTTIASTVGNITKIEFTCTASGTTKYGPGCFDAQDGYSYEDSNGVWTGNAASVSFTAGTAQVRATKIVVTVGEGGGGVTPDPDPDPQPGDNTLTGNGTLNNPYTAADATIVAGQLESGAKTATDVYVKGKISTIKYTFDAEHGTATFFISNDGTTNGEFQVYGAYYLENKAWVDGNTQIAVGDEVVICGKLTNYKGTPETASKEAYIYSLNGVTKNENGETPEPTVTDINVAKALEIINALEDGKTTAEEYQVTGYIVSIAEISTQYGNATFVIADEATAEGGLTVYRVKGFNGEAIADENIVKVGDQVVVKGKLQKYVKNGEVTPEVATGGSIVSINGAATGISAAKASAQTAAIVYNLAGQKVGADYKGIVIVNGKKMIQK